MHDCRGRDIECDSSKFGDALDSLEVEAAFETAPLYDERRGGLTSPKP